MSRYAKFLVALIPVAITLLQLFSDAFGDGVVTTEEWVQLGIALLTALGVYAIPNRPPAGRPSNPAVSETG